MCVLWEVESQHEWLGSSILDYNTTTRKGRLCNESDLWINLTKLHILIVADFKLSNATASSIGVEKGRAIRTEICFRTRLNSEAKN